jgi:hypothetical protein
MHRLVHRVIEFPQYNWIEDNILSDSESIHAQYEMMALCRNPQEFAEFYRKYAAAMIETFLSLVYSVDLLKHIENSGFVSNVPRLFYNKPSIPEGLFNVFRSPEVLTVLIRRYERPNQRKLYHDKFASIYDMALWRRLGVLFFMIAGCTLPRLKAQGCILSILNTDIIRHAVLTVL